MTNQCRSYYWRKSTRSDDKECVEVASDLDHVYVRDSKTRDTVLRFTRNQWRVLLRSL